MGHCFSNSRARVAGRKTRNERERALTDCGGAATVTVPLRDHRSCFLCIDVVPWAAHVFGMAKGFAAGMLLGLMGVLPAGCASDDKDDKDEICAAYGCLNGAFWNATFEVAPTVKAVDVRFCEAGDCRDASFEIPETALSCERGQPLHVCVGRRGTQLEIEASWMYNEDAHEPKDGKSYQLIVSNQATGDVLFDEGRAAKFEVTSEDNCHRCWRAQLGEAP